MSNDSLAKTVEYRGFNIEVHYDSDPMNPRKEFDHFGHMVCFHNRYDLGDEQNPGRSPDEWLTNLAHECDDTLEQRLDWWYNKMCPDYRDQNKATLYADKKQELIEKVLDKHIFILPLYLYDHSGISMSTGSFGYMWDSGQVGYIYVKKEDVRKEWKVKQISPKLKEQVYANLESEVKEYDDYLTGSVYGFIIKDHNDEEIDDGSCWGFFGYDCTKDNGYMIEECKSQINYYMKELEEEAWKENREHAPLLEGLG